MNDNIKAKRALVADEDLSVLRLLDCFLRGIGLTVECADNQETALRSFALSRPDILLCDVHLGGWHGIDTAQSCRELEPSLKVVMISQFPDHLAHAMLAGFKHRFRKPFDLAALKGMIQQLVPNDGEGFPPGVEPMAARRRMNPLNAADAYWLGGSADALASPA